MTRRPPAEPSPMTLRSEGVKRLTGHRDMPRVPTSFCGSSGGPPPESEKRERTVALNKLTKLIAGSVLVSGVAFAQPTPPSPAPLLQPELRRPDEPRWIFLSGRSPH